MPALYPYRIFISHAWKWMQYEADEALRMGKPIIAIMPRGGVYMPVELQAKATTQVGWSSVSIVNAIRTLA